MSRRLLRSLKQDLSWGSQEWLVSAVAGHWLVPRALRYVIYRACGIRTQSAGIYSGVVITGRKLQIGEGTFINRDCYFEAGGGITIGRECLLAPQVGIFSSTHAVGEDGEHEREVVLKEVVIGDRCWLGARSTILPGVRICDDVIVAAGAVVTEDITHPGVWGGVPAKLLREGR